MLGKLGVRVRGRVWIKLSLEVCKLGQLGIRKYVELRLGIRS